MKALILAAGYGTRLLPYTKTIAKPLFTLGGIPILAHTIQYLIGFGCRQIMVNTHHLPDQIADFIETGREKFTAQITCIHEPMILDTGGAIANVKDAMAGSPFFVINGDVVTNVDLADVWHCHLRNRALATLVLHDRKEFNKVAVDAGGWITDFNSPGKGLAFTGIQVLSPQIFDYMPPKTVFSSIDLFAGLCQNRQIKAYVDAGIFWEDIGTPETYARAARQWTGAAALKTQLQNTEIFALAGDGSDRNWFRAIPSTTCPSSSLEKPGSVVLCDHGICLPGSEARAELEAFVHIGNHLFRQRISVPQILAHDPLAGMVALEDLGDTHLADQVRNTCDTSTIKQMYQNVVNQLILFSQKGANGFDPNWTYQTPTYSKALILEKECRYFLDAFINNYLKKNLSFETFEEEFCFVAQKALDHGFTGLMHRDCQSKNIMIKNDTVYFIDFQSARTGPFQYDLASLLLDPYVTLPRQVQQDLVSYAMDRLGLDAEDQRKRFARCFHFCCMTRNLQILGAFAHLSLVKKKTGFEKHIPAAVTSLQQLMKNMDTSPVPKLTKLITSL